MYISNSYAADIINGKVQVKKLLAIEECGGPNVVDYALGWFETHPEEWPKSYGDFLKLCEEWAPLARESEDQDA